MIVVVDNLLWPSERPVSSQRMHRLKATQVLYLLSRKQQMLKLVRSHLMKTNTDSLVAKSTVYVNNFVVTINCDML